MQGATFLNWAEGLMLVATRLGVLFLATPPFASIAIPLSARIVVLGALALGMSAGTEVPYFEASGVITAVLHEVVVGAVFAAGLFSGFGAFNFAGRILDYQIGFGMANLIDIATRRSLPLLGALLAMAGAAYFFAIDGHVLLLRAVHLSFAKIPVGLGFDKTLPEALIAQFAAMFVLGFALVAPVIITLFLVDIGLAFVSRTIPQLNVFITSFAIKSGIGLLVLALSIRMASSTVDRIFNSAFDFFDGWLR